MKLVVGTMQTMEKTISNLQSKVEEEQVHDKNGGSAENAPL